MAGTTPTGWQARAARKWRRRADLDLRGASGLWRRAPGGRPLSYWELAEELVDYAVEMGFTHIELMPISEYPFDGSWGYQPVGMYAPTIRHGTAAGVPRFRRGLRTAGLGVILDWVPGISPPTRTGSRGSTARALRACRPARGLPPRLEHADLQLRPRREVANFLTANALYWLEEYHVDGLRVDAVASMLYRDYSRKEGEWVPNIAWRAREPRSHRLPAAMNTVVYGEVPRHHDRGRGIHRLAGRVAPVDAGGLGFGYKWNMGWMNDTLDYIGRDPVHRAITTTR
jgi:1,4-alpha-glucan branching enzyme